MPATKADLDRMSAGGCQAPGCDHADHALYLHSRCHIKAPMFVRRKDGFRIQCCRLDCQAPVLEVQGTFEDAASATPAEWMAGQYLAQACHRESAVWPRYTHGSGRVDLLCCECKALVGAIVLEEEKDAHTSPA